MEGRGTPHVLAIGLRRDGIMEPGFHGHHPMDDKAPHPVARKPCIALRSEDRATAARILPCHAHKEA
jgi:hypothetical protein